MEKPVIKLADAKGVEPHRFCYAGREDQGLDYWEGE